MSKLPTVREEDMDARVQHRERIAAAAALHKAFSEELKRRMEKAGKPTAGQQKEVGRWSDLITGGGDRGGGGETQRQGCALRQTKKHL